MNFVAVGKLPREGKGVKFKLQTLIDMFVESPHQVVKLEWEKGEYKTASICYTTMQAAVKRSHCAVKVIRRGDDVYLVKTI